MVSASASFTGPEYYDLLMGPLWFDPFALDLVRRVPVRPPGHVLEIACFAACGSMEDFSTSLWYSSQVV